MILVEFLNLTFDLVVDIKRVSNVKFIPLGSAAPVVANSTKTLPLQAFVKADTSPTKTPEIGGLTAR
jgi:hypothetical protein